MNFYDKVHELVRCLKETEEYKNYLSLREKIKKDDSMYTMLKEFKQKQKEHQIEYLNTGKINEEKQKELENLYSIVIKQEKARQLLESEIRIDVLLADMQKIVAEGIKDILEF